METVAWNEASAVADPVVLGLDELDEVSGGNPIAVAGLAVGAFGVAYGVGKDVAKKRNRQDRSRGRGRR